ncbi:MAG: hypothetical protein HWN79_10440 [Candidatus Lokiarchaeota archaeon]|nr:hypothetical protein [Candidatus Lokiarchaeota archaeon]
MAQIWPIIYSSYFSYKLLKRAKNRSTYTLSCFFILYALTDVLANFSILFLFTPLAYFFYILAMYFFFFDHCFFIIFSWVLVKLEEKTPYWKFRLIIILYGITSTYVFWIGYFFNGIQYDSITNWVPRFSWFFLVFSWALLAAFLLIPQIYFSLKLSKIFEGVILKRRINMFIISSFFQLAVVFAFFLYHFLFENQIYRTIYMVSALIISTTSAFLIYKSFGKELD